MIKIIIKSFDGARNFSFAFADLSLGDANKQVFVFSNHLLLNSLCSANFGYPPRVRIKSNRRL